MLFYALSLPGNSCTNLSGGAARVLQLLGSLLRCLMRSRSASKHRLLQGCIASRRAQQVQRPLHVIVSLQGHCSAS